MLAMWRIVCLTSFLIAALLVNVFGSDTRAPEFNKQSFEAYARYLLLWGPEIRVEIDDPKPSAVSGLDEVRVRGLFEQAVQLETFYIAKDRRTIIRGSLLDVTKNPFELVRSKLRVDEQPSFGGPAAPVVIVIFSDFECQFCKMESSVIRNDLVKAYPKQVQVVFRDFPIARMHPWAMQAAVTGRCIFHQKPAVFWDYHDWVFDHQADLSSDNLSAKITEAMQDKGLNQMQLDACIKDKATTEEINHSIGEAAELGVTGTPVLFVNGRMMPGAAWPSLHQAIEAELEHQNAPKAVISDCGCSLMPTAGSEYEYNVLNSAPQFP